MPYKVVEAESDDLGSEVDFGFMKKNQLEGTLLIIRQNGEHKNQ
ncbi:hypothetical protein PP182_16085 [Maribacter sp. PR1]|uniref:Uncharacterized protein n=1 Tax=Maribacter cobaltidurans TaxID=1178778 RepID=A0ABU7IXE5_9FLAO|nr:MULTISPECIES: hypothetical protein [Maribacter]MDC6390213.1 hypothetical protein [Maribacter sp. PR1]MEE1977603.1 hypothetical protein [Maribacter cobaltidurans]